MGVKEDESGPWIRVEALQGSDWEEIHVAGEWDVLEHEEEISDSQAAENAVDGRPTQFLLAQNDDVENVGQTAGQAENEAQTAVNEPNRPADFPQPHAAVVHFTVEQSSVGQSTGVIQIVIQIVFGDVGRVQVLLEPYVRRVGRHPRQIFDDRRRRCEAVDKTSSTGAISAGERR